MTAPTAPTIGEALDLLADRDPGAPAVADGRAALTRSELRRRSTDLARRLLAEGLLEDAVVAVRGGNAVETVVAVCAVWRAGATPLPLGARMPLEEQREVVRTAGAALVLGADPDTFAGVRSLPLAAAPIAGAPLPPLAATSWKAVPTSGSTGRPKVVLSTAPARVDPDRAPTPFLPLAARQLVVGPVTHSAPFTYAMRGLMTGHALRLLPESEPAEVLQAIAVHRISWVLLVPAMLHRILRLPPAALASADLSSLEQVVHLGAPVDPEVKRRWIDLLGPERLVEVYAGSESNGLTMIRGDEWLHRPGSVGRPIGGTRLRVVGPDGRPLPAGRIGRVELRRTGGPAYRYLGAPTPEGEWDTLGDDGRLDEDGWLFLADRGADRIVRGGVGIYPAEVEHVLERHPDVRSAVVVGAPDDALGQRVHAVVDVGGSPCAASDLLEWARARLASDRAVDTIRLVHEPVRDDAGKARRRDWTPPD